MKHRRFAVTAIVLSLLVATHADRPRAAANDNPLAVGVAGHAFDHLSGFDEQGATAAAAGSTVIYSTGVGALGYSGLSSADELNKTAAATARYLKDAKASGIRLSIGYVCATSIVKTDSFDRNWSPEFRAQFMTPPSAWMQQDLTGKALPSWYGGDYHPACMNNPDWRVYEKAIVRRQIEAGNDGIFFDNPTVHPQGCYCEHCMKKFAAFLTAGGQGESPASDSTIASLRKIAADHPKDFLRFRATIAADFLTDMRRFARTINPAALITCNNSLNSPEMLFSQARTYGYNIEQLSTAEDLVVIEDMGTQPRTVADGSAAGNSIEYGPVYEILRPISHDKPIVAVTLVNADYHTPANLMRLATAEAAAHGASYLSWPTWPTEVRARMIAAVRPQADFLRENAALLNDTKPAADVALLFPFRRWVETPDSAVLTVARALARANVQFTVLHEDDLAKLLAENAPPVLVVESASILTKTETAVIEKYKANGGQVVWGDQKDWLAQVQTISKTPMITLDAPPAVRAVVRTQAGKTIVHLLNLNVQSISSFEDRVTPAANVRMRVRCSLDHPKSATALSADADATRGAVPFTVASDHCVELAIPKLAISTILVIE